MDDDDDDDDDDHHHPRRPSPPTHPPTIRLNHLNIITDQNIIHQHHDIDVVRVWLLSSDRKRSSR
jgi:hypothetical protein